MKKTFRKVLASLLTAVMLLTVAPLSGIADIDFSELFAFKASALLPSGSCGTNVTYTFDSVTGLLTISGTGAMTEYSFRSSPFYEDSSIKSIVIEDGVTSVGSYAFYYCEELTSVTIPDSVTGIGRDAFEECTSLTDITIPDSVTSIGNYAFSGCQSLTDITIPDSVAIIGEQAFWGCTGLTSVTIPDSVTRIGSGAFINCTNLSEIDYYGTQSQWDEITDWDSVLVLPDYSVIHFHGQCGENVYWTLDSSTGLLTISGTGAMTDFSYGGSPFYGNSLIKSVVIEDGVTSIGSCAFCFCLGLTSVTIPDSVTRIGINAFDNCTGLTSVNISDIAAWCNIGFIGSSNPLYYAKNLYLNGEFVTDLVIPDSVTSIGAYAFDECTGLTSVTIPDSVTSIGAYAFDECTGLTSVTIPDSVTSIGDYAFSGVMNIVYNGIASGAPPWGANNYNKYADGYMLFNDAEKTELLRCNTIAKGSLTIPDSVTRIGDYAFYYCISLTNIIIPDSVTSIGESAFNSCISLTSITIPDSVTSIENYAFNSCSSLTSITIPDSVTRIGVGPFGFCGSLTSLTIGNNVTNIDSSAFSHSSLSTVNYNAVSCESASFSDLRNSLTDFVIGDNVKYLPPSLLNNCDGLTTLTIPANVEKIGSKAIAECDNLQTVIFESGEYIDMDSSVFLNSPNVTILCKENSYMHYYADMEGLKYCIIDDSNNPNFTVKNDILVSYNGEAENVFLSSASKIGFEAFKGNTDVKSVELANNVTRIYNSAFKNCTGLEKIIIPKSVASIGDSAFTGCDSLTIWCYAGSYAEAYAVNHDIPLEYITLNLSDNSITVADFEEITLDASFSTSMIDSGEIIWASSNPEIATVENGRVNVLDAGEAEITATTASGLSASCEIKVDLKLDSAADAVIDNESGIVFGSDMVNKDADGIKNLFLNSRISVTDTDGAVGTGDKVSLLKADGTVYREIDIVIFGDVNGDGWYDGTDSIIVNCLANGLLSKEQVGEAVYMAADCNHDDVIDENDVALLEQAGIILAGVDQSKSADELMTDSAYVEYLSLIDQNPQEETPTDESVDEGFNLSIIQRIFNFIIELLNMIKSFIAGL